MAFNKNKFLAYAKLRGTYNGIFNIPFFITGRDNY